MALRTIRQLWFCWMVRGNFRRSLGPNVSTGGSRIARYPPCCRFGRNCPTVLPFRGRHLPKEVPRGYATRECGSLLVYTQIGIVPLVSGGHQKVCRDRDAKSERIDIAFMIKRHKNQIFSSLNCLSSIATLAITSFEKGKGTDVPLRYV